MAAPSFDLSGKVALITGAGRGIGLAIGEALAAHGAAVAIQDIEESIAAEAVKKIADRGGRAIALGGDIKDLTLPARLIQQTVDQLGGLHILINNASIQSACDWMEAKVETMQSELSTNVISPIVFCQLATPIFRKQKFGRIINIGSIQQKSGFVPMLSYSLSKAAIEKLTTALAKELAGDGITVNLIAPGWMATVRTQGDFKDEQEKVAKGLRSVPVGRVGEGFDCAGLAVLLCSKAGEYITGQSIYVDGGLSIK